MSTVRRGLLSGKGVDDFQTVNSWVGTEVFGVQSFNASVKTCGHDHAVPEREAVSSPQVLGNLCNRPVGSSKRHDLIRPLMSASASVRSKPNWLSFRLAERYSQATCPQQDPIRERRYQSMGNCLFSQISGIVNIHQNVRINGVHAARPWSE